MVSCFLTLAEEAMSYQGSSGLKKESLQQGEGGRGLSLKQTEYLLSVFTP